MPTPVAYRAGYVFEGWEPAVTQTVPAKDTTYTAVWKEADQSDLQWIELYQLDDGSYYTDLYVADYGENPGDYNVHIYVIDELGTPTIVTGQTKTIN